MNLLYFHGDLNPGIHVWIYIYIYVYKSIYVGFVRCLAMV